MWLLNSETHEMREFMSDNDVPEYAILSHTWGADEISFADLRALPGHESEVEPKEGFKKIEFCCRQAVEDGLNWVWVDTCCIDKSSSAELSEAINSMFSWYKKATVCYAHLTDIEKHSTTTQEMADELSRCRWFTRGWTLQELIASKTIKFYSRDWQFLGTKAGLCDIISRISGIEVSFLWGRDLEQASVSKRMSWASQRQTTRDEDMAYCLLGIFDLHMPLLYGEGKRAFRRLQEEIMKAYPDDHTLFAWGTVVEDHSMILDEQYPRSANYKINLPRWNSVEAGKTLFGLLAQSPADFRHSATFAPHRHVTPFYNHPKLRASPPSPFGKGIRIELPWISSGSSYYHWPQFKLTQARVHQLILLLCGDAARPDTCLQVLVQRGHGASWARSNELVLLFEFNIWVLDLDRRKEMFYIEPERPVLLQTGDFIVQQLTVNTAIFNIWGEYRKNKFRYPPGGYWDEHAGILRLYDGDRGTQVWRKTWPFRRHANRVLAIEIKRIRGADGSLTSSSVQISITPLVFDQRSRSEYLQDKDGVLWWDASGRAAWDNSLYSYVVPMAGGTWVQEMETLPSSPVVHTYVERVFFEDVEGQKFVDVIKVDIRRKAKRRRNRARGDSAEQSSSSYSRIELAADTETSEELYT